MYDLLMAAAATPSPTPQAPPAELVTPGPWGFGVIAVLTLAVVLLVIDMLRRIRRSGYREDVRAELDAEEQARASTRATDTDDEDIDPDADPTRR